MIGVKIPMKDVTKTKAQNIRDLTDYIVDPSEEKVLYAKARGFLTDTFIGRQAEMIALAEEAVNSSMPVKHYVISWQEGERPTPEQIEETVDIFQREMGLKGHQVIYAVHQNTDNIHLHIAVNLVHPDTLKVVKPNKGFDIEAVHRAIARIEHAQGWNREENGRYVVRDNNKLVRANIFRDALGRQPGKQRSDMEIRTGEKSAERIAQEKVPQIVKAAQRWQDLHEQLALIGMRYVQNGSGALIYVGETPIKASSADRAASMPALQKRFGVFEPAPDGLQVAEFTPEPLKGDTPGWREYYVERKTHYSDKTTKTSAMRGNHGAERKLLLAQHKQRRKTKLGGSWRGRGAMMNALRSVIAAQQAAERAALRERHALERQQLRAMYGRFPDFEQWLKTGSSPEQAGAWKYSNSQAARIQGDSYVQPVPRDIRGYSYQIRRLGGVNYKHRNGRVAFTDLGRNISVNDFSNRDTVLAALQLAAKKWGTVEIHGNDEYKALCVSLAAQHGFKITNPELQAAIEAARRPLKGHAQPFSGAEERPQRASTPEGELTSEKKDYKMR